jgi:hypothetical protein
MAAKKLNTVIALDGNVSFAAFHLGTGACMAISPSLRTRCSPAIDRTRQIGAYARISSHPISDGVTKDQHHLRRSAENSRAVLGDGSHEIMREPGTLPGGSLAEWGHDDCGTL